VNKSLALFFVFIVLSSLMMLTINPVNAQKPSPPSVPEFSVKLADYSYDVLPSSTTTIDPYTGKETTTNTIGYRVDDFRLEITIKNQPFTPYTNAEGYACNLYYTIQLKGHFEENWQTTATEIVQTTSQYTVVTRPKSYADGSQLDFRVQAAIGYVIKEGRIPPAPPWTYFVAETIGEWSEVQKFIVPGVLSSVPPSQTATQSTNPTTTSDNKQPQQSEQSQILDFLAQPFLLLGIGILVGVGVTIVGVLILTRLRFSRLQTNS
jgi:hypothetical protein